MADKLGKLNDIAESFYKKRMKKEPVEEKAEGSTDSVGEELLEDSAAKDYLDVAKKVKKK